MSDTTLKLDAESASKIRNSERVEIDLCKDSGIVLSRPNTAGRYARNVLAMTGIFWPLKRSYNRQQWQAFRRVL